MTRAVAMAAGASVEDASEHGVANMVYEGGGIDRRLTQCAFS